MNREVRLYIESFDKDIRERLLMVRERIFSRIDQSGEGIAYGIPYVSCRGKRLLLYSAAKKWIAIHPFPETIDAFKDRLTTYSLSTGTIRFPHTKEIDYEMIGDIVSYRMKGTESSA